jgi:hypothetical protein
MFRMYMRAYCPDRQLYYHVACTGGVVTDPQGAITAASPSPAIAGQQAIQPVDPATGVVSTTPSTITQPQVWIVSTLKIQSGIHV